jgi:hypothetical protein
VVSGKKRQRPWEQSFSKKEEDEKQSAVLNYVLGMNDEGMAGVHVEEEGNEKVGLPIQGMSDDLFVELMLMMGATYSTQGTW